MIKNTKGYPLTAMLTLLFTVTLHADVPLYTEHTEHTEHTDNWQETLNAAKGQTVYMNAWGGSANINNYLHWAATELRRRYDVKLRHVKVDDIAPVISRVIAEKNAGRNTGGSADIIWLNGENFRTLNSNGLLYGPFASRLPNWRYIDPKEKPTTVVDFGEPVNGMEVPWGMAQLVFIYDTALVSKPPKTMQELLSFSKKNPGLFTYPAPPDFVGTTFLKQALIELIANPERLQKPVGDDFNRVTKPLWDYLDALHPTLWRRGRIFPNSSVAMLSLVDDGELAFALSFNPGAARAGINDGLLPNTVRTYVHKGGTIGNSHFLAIPYNSSAKAAAEVTINFLISPEAQLRKADPKIWGDPTVLSASRLQPEDQKALKQQNAAASTFDNKTPIQTLTEPHPDWVKALEEAWLKRYRR